MLDRPGFKWRAALLAAGLALTATQEVLGADRVAVAVGEFRSSVAELDSRGAADMFVTALMNAGHYRVMRKGKYLFEGTITETGVSSDDRRHALSLGGLNLGRSKNKAMLGIDIHVSLAATGEVVDSISVRRPVAGSSASVSGVGTAAANVLAKHGKSLPFIPDVSHESSRQDSLDGTLRALIEAAVAELDARGTVK
jgi:uncharacterized protein YfiM (DUF2279 family)